MERINFDEISTGALSEDHIMKEAYDEFVSHFPEGKKNLAPGFDQFSKIVRSLHSKGLTPELTARQMGFFRSMVISLEQALRDSNGDGNFDLGFHLKIDE